MNEATSMNEAPPPTCPTPHHVVQVQDRQLHLCRLQQAGPVNVHLIMDAWAIGGA